MIPRLANITLYQVGWFCCVLGAAADRPWVGSTVALGLVAVHIALLPRSDVANEMQVLGLTAAMGAAVDSFQSCAGLLEFRSGYVIGCLAPPWIVVMWIQFATLFRFGLAFLQGRYALAAGLGAVGGPLAFWIGMRLGAVRLPNPLASLTVLAVIWALACPAVVRITAIHGDKAARYPLLER